MNENNKPTDPQTFFHDHAPKDLRNQWKQQRADGPEPDDELPEIGSVREIVAKNRVLSENLAELAQRYRRFMLLYGAFAERMSKAVNVLDKHSGILSAVLPAGVTSTFTKHVQKAQAISRKIERAAKKDPSVLEDVEGRDPWNS